MNTKSHQVRNMLGCCARDQKIWRYHEIPIRLGTTTIWTEMTTIFEGLKGAMWTKSSIFVRPLFLSLSSELYVYIPWMYSPRNNREKLGWSLGSPRLPNGIQTSIWPKQKNKKKTHTVKPTKYPNSEGMIFFCFLVLLVEGYGFSNLIREGTGIRTADPSAVSRPPKPQSCCWGRGKKTGKRPG